MQNQFNKYIEEQFSFLKQSNIIVAISGGVDSVVLAYLCKSYQLNFTLAHCNFNLRGEESVQDENFVKKLGAQLKVDVLVKQFDTTTYAKQHKRSIQMAARELRYNWFKCLTQQLDYNYILTAHHSDDNLETILINLTRGTGLNGLTGIPAINDNVVRPLLPFSRESIEHFAKAQNIKWREDSSNSSRKYLRNKLRHDVIPILKALNPNLLNSFDNTLQYLKASSEVLSETINNASNKVIDYKNEFGTFYKISEFKRLKNIKFYMYEFFNAYGFSAWDDLLNLLDAQSGKMVISDAYRIIKNRDHLILTLKYSKKIKPFCISEHTVFNSKCIQNQGLNIEMSLIDSTENQIEDFTYFDLETLKFPLEIRPWQQGDRFKPLGLNGQKKISKYLKDEKFSLPEKEQTLVLVSNNAIVWIINKREDDRYKVTTKTKKMLAIKIT